MFHDKVETEEEKSPVKKDAVKWSIVFILKLILIFGVCFAGTYLGNHIQAKNAEIKSAKTKASDSGELLVALKDIKRTLLIVKSTIDDVSGDVSTIKDDVSDIESDVSSIESDVGSIQVKIGY